MGIIFLTPWSWMTTLPKRTCKKGARGIVSNLDEGRRDGGGGQATLMQPLRHIILYVQVSWGIRFLGVAL